MSFQNSLPINHSLSGVTFEQKENWKESDNRKKENKKKMSITTSQKVFKII